MNLDDNAILELNELCNAVVEGNITRARTARLSHLLASSEAARRFYVRAMALSASLYSYAGEMQSEAADAIVPPPSRVVRLPVWWILAPLAAAAMVMLLLRLGARPQPDAAPPLKTRESVARLTGLRECQWQGESTAPQSGEKLFQGERLELTKGFAEITFDSGARVVLEGPASFEINSAWDARLLRGALKANIPPEAIGFRISNPAVEVVDMGTEFSMIADASGAADVLVLKGEVEVNPSAGDDDQGIVLHEREARRFAQSGVSDVDDSAQMFARFTQPVPLDHFVPATDYLHWSFDETAGSLFRADSSGRPAGAFDARLEDAANPLTAHVNGRREKALRFDGHLFAEAAYPGISGNQPHTVLFWVKVPKDAQLSDAYAMVAWATSSRKLNSHPVHISWNRNPTEGTVGVLRTDYGRGFALGATPLRDGRWHHVAVVFAPGADDNTPAEVKQYVDGRFEGEGRPSPPGSSTARTSPANVLNTIWLGCRLGNDRPRKDRFRGEMDELFIADGALMPQEIVQLMNGNQPTPAGLAARRTHLAQSAAGALPEIIR
jgi:Concanavalin A-like lectin/glucanases superfamily